MQFKLKTFSLIELIELTEMEFIELTAGFSGLDGKLTDLNE